MQHAINPETEIEYFLANAPPDQDPPTFALILGPVASGKTRFRRANYATGFAVLDAGEIFIRLSQGVHYDAPPPHLQAPMDLIGRTVAQRAIAERRNLVTEMIGDHKEGTYNVIEHMKKNGYKVQIEALTVDLDESMRRNEARGENNISAYFVQPMHARWVCNL